MKYYVCYRKKNHLKETTYLRNVSNLIKVKLDIETIYRWQDVGNLLNDVVEWRIYDEKKIFLKLVQLNQQLKEKKLVGLQRCNMKKFFNELEILLSCGAIAYILLRIVESLQKGENK